MGIIPKIPYCQKNVYLSGFVEKRNNAFPSFFLFSEILKLEQCCSSASRQRNGLLEKIAVALLSTDAINISLNFKAFHLQQEELLKQIFDTLQIFKVAICYGVPFL